MDNEKVSKVLDQYADYINDGTGNWDEKNKHLMNMLLDACDDKESHDCETKSSSESFKNKE